MKEQKKRKNERKNKEGKEHKKEGGWVGRREGEKTKKEKEIK